MKVQIKIRAHHEEGAEQLYREFEYLLNNTLENPDKYMNKLENWINTYKNQVKIMIDNVPYGIEDFFRILKKTKEKHKEVK